MKKVAVATILAFAMLLSMVGSAAAITGGQLDGDGHPYGGLVLVPGEGVCSGTLIDKDLVLTAGHCTDFFSYNEFDEVWITFDSEAAVDDDWVPIPGEGTWYVSHSWVTHPAYVDAAWPFTADYGLMFLDTPVTGITPAELPQAGLLDELIGTTGQTQERFYDVELWTKRRYCRRRVSCSLFRLRSQNFRTTLQSKQRGSRHTGSGMADTQQCAI